jgi:type IV pilus assembly protein PilN
MARINLLPWREEERQRRTKDFLSRMFLAGLLAVGAAAFGVYYTQGLVDHQNARNAYLQQEIDRLKAELEEIKELESTKSKLLARMEIIQQLQTRRPQIVHLFHELAATLPDGVYLTGITQSTNRITLEGRAESNARVSAYMRNLDDSVWLANPRLEVIQAESGEEISKFTLHLDQTHPDSEAENTGKPAKANGARS